MNIYSRLLKLYKNNSKKTPKEDFTTEILVGILEKNPELLNKYVNEFLKIEGEEFEISSQCYYPSEKSIIVDVVIENVDKLIFIENKVDSKEGEDQLERYRKYLEKVDDKKTYLFYCTKVKDEKENINQFKWEDIYNHFKGTESELLLEFLEYLEEEGIVMTKQFNTNDIKAMENMSETLIKMDVVLDGASELLEKYFGKPKNKRETEIKKYNFYSASKGNILKDSSDSEISLVFNFDKEEYETPHLEICLWVPEDAEYFSKFKACESEALNKKFEHLIVSGGVWIFDNKPVEDFLVKENQIESMKKWFEERIEGMDSFRKSTKDFGWK